MMMADYLMGHETVFIDTGNKAFGEEVSKPKAGKRDPRGQYELTTSAHEESQDADIIMAHTAMPLEWLGKDIPIVWVLHGRPLACFRHERLHPKSNAYSILTAIAGWDRVKYLVTFWPSHAEYWKAFVPESKMVVLDSPPVDTDRFSKEGDVHTFEKPGKINIVLADAFREDVDLFEIAHGAIAFARKNKDVKFHFYGLNRDDKVFGYVLQALSNVGGLGDVVGRVRHIETAYRAADIVLSPHVTTTRIIGEALCCGTPVIAAKGNLHATRTATMSDPNSIEQSISTLCKDIRDSSDWVKERVKSAAGQFSLSRYGQNMIQLYRKGKKG